MRTAPLLLIVLAGLTLPTASALPDNRDVAKQLADVTAPVAATDPTAGEPTTLAVQFVNRAPVEVAEAYVVLVTVFDGVAGDYMPGEPQRVRVGETVDLTVTWTPEAPGQHLVRGYVMFDDLKLDVAEVTIPVLPPATGGGGGDGTDDAADDDAGGGDAPTGPDGGALSSVKRAVPAPFAGLAVWMAAVLARRR